MKNEHLYQYILGIADNSLILGQRLGELCGHGPNLETDIALTNISLDLIGQTRSYYQYAAKISEENKKAIEITDRERISNRPSMTAEGLVQGYYIVTNVFKNRNNAIRWKERMDAKGHNARTFINSDTQLMYIYVESDENLTIMLDRKKVLEKLDYLDGIWIARLNFD